MSYFIKILQKILTRTSMDFLFCFVSLILVFKSLFLLSGSKLCEIRWGLCIYLAFDGHVFVSKQLPEASKARRCQKLHVFVSKQLPEASKAARSFRWACVCLKTAARSYFDRNLSVDSNFSFFESNPNQHFLLILNFVHYFF